MNDTPPDKPIFGWSLIICGVMAVLMGMAIYISHTYQWLRYGLTVQYSTTEFFADFGLGYPSVTWVGVQRVIDWIMRSSAAAVLFWSGVILAMLGGNSVEAHDKRRREFEARRWERENAASAHGAD